MRLYRQGFRGHSIRKMGRCWHDQSDITNRYLNDFINNYLETIIIADQTGAMMLHVCVTFHPYSFPFNFLSWTNPLPYTASLAVTTCCTLVSSLAVPTCTIPMPSCVSAMLTCVWLCLWQPIAFLPLTSCSAHCLNEAVRTTVYKP